MYRKNFFSQKIRFITTLLRNLRLRLNDFNKQSKTLETSKLSKTFKTFKTFKTTTNIMSAAERTAQILKVVDQSRSTPTVTKVTKVTAAERTALLLATADTKVKTTQTFKDMYEAHQQSTESPKKCKSKITVVETPTDSAIDHKSPNKSKSKITVVETPTEYVVVVETPTDSAAERTTQLLTAADTKAERVAQTFKEMYEARQQSTESPKKRGRPAGSKDKVKRQSKTNNPAVVEVPKKKRGCPKGSHKKCGICGGVGHNKRTCPI